VENFKGTKKESVECSGRIRFDGADKRDTNLHVTIINIDSRMEQSIYALGRFCGMVTGSDAVMTQSQRLTADRSGFENCVE